MSVDSVIAQLDAWKQRHDDLYTQIDALMSVVTADPGSPLMTAIYRVADADTKLVAQAVGDTDEWLLWFEHECELGMKPMEASCPGGKLCTVKTVKQLAALIKACRQ